MNKKHFLFASLKSLKKAVVPDPELDPDPLVRGTGRGSGGSAQKCHGSPTLHKTPDFDIFLDINLKNINPRDWNRETEKFCNFVPRTALRIYLITSSFRIVKNFTFQILRFFN
jgi:hypothetical protein